MSEDQQFAFLNLINEFTPTHLKILHNTHQGFFWSPIMATMDHKVDVELSRIFLREYEELRDQGDFVYQIVNDLNSKNLLTTVRARISRESPNEELMVIGVSEWGQFIRIKPGNCNHVDLDSQFLYLTIPTELGISFLNYIYSTKEE